MFDDLFWLWRVSRVVCNGQESHARWRWKLIDTFRVQKNRLIFLVKAVLLADSLKPFIHAEHNTPIRELIEKRPETVGAVVWPYQSNSWDAKTRLRKIKEHYSIINSSYKKFDFNVDGALIFVRAGDMYENLLVVIDRPKWFIREGQLVFNLFLANVRIFSLAFSFGLQSGKLVSYVGALQGRDLEGMRETYKEMTKALYGMRPHDFLFELFRSFCKYIGVSKILAVSEAYRHHRSKYFGNAEHLAKLNLNYDKTWIERGGILESPDFYAINVDPYLKKIEDIPSKKRSMYRHRFKLLQTMEERIHISLDHLGDNSFIVCPFHSL